MKWWFRIWHWFNPGVCIIRGGRNNHVTVIGMDGDDITELQCPCGGRIRAVRKEE